MKRRLHVLFLCFVAFFAFFTVFMRISRHVSENSFPRHRAQSLHRGKLPSGYLTKTRHLTWQQVYNRFKSKTSELCRNKCVIKKNPACNATSYSDWDKLLSLAQVVGIPLYGEREYMFNYERAYMDRNPILTDKQTLPDLTKSIIHHLDSTGREVRKQNVYCHHMGQVSFRVDFFDGYGKQRRRGGDEVRAWIVGNPQSPDLFDYSAPGRIEDLKNGSYLATITCVWTGYATLKIGLAYPWEYIRAALRSFRLGAHLMLMGTFKRGNVEENTLCSSHPNVPGRPCLCNFTDWNDLPFFCGKPLDKRLTCNDLKSTQTQYHIPKRDLTKAELATDKEMARLPSQMLVNQTVNIVVKGPVQPLPKKPCSKMDRSVWWENEYPRGFWAADKNWTSLICQEHEVTNVWAEECLTNSTLWIIGDSNTRLIFVALKDLLNCSEHDKSFVCNERKKISIVAKGHEYPFYSTHRKGYKKFSGVRKYISRIPSTGKHILFLHYYLHPTRTHPGALYLCLKKLKQTVAMFLKRNPRARVFLRGPHITTFEASRNHMLGGDVLGSFHLESFYSIFHDLRHKVTFLDGWDMSIALENPRYHPSHQFTLAMIRTFLSSMC